MASFRDGVFLSRVGLNKPEPAIYALAAKRFSAAPHELAIFNDHPANVEAARTAGWNAVAFSAPATCVAAANSATRGTRTAKN